MQHAHIARLPTGDGDAGDHDGSASAIRGHLPGVRVHSQRDHQPPDHLGAAGGGGDRQCAPHG